MGWLGAPGLQLEGYAEDGTPWGMGREWQGPGEFCFHRSKELAEAQADVDLRKGTLEMRVLLGLGVGGLGQNRPRKAQLPPRRTVPGVS